ncbi:hypothetical protein ABTF55_22320, partial [Acinetobacter baumannii]
GREYLDPLPDPEADTAPEEAGGDDDEDGLGRPDIEPMVEDEEPAAAVEAAEIASPEAAPMPVAPESPEAERPEPAP